MFVRCIGTGSKGNSYALYDDNNKILLLDLGLPRKDILKAIDYRVSDVVGCIVTHSHLDHSKSVKDFEDMGISVFKPYDETKACPLKIRYGNFDIQAFKLPHNGTPNYGYYIKADGQKILYLTDFEYCQFNFKALGVNHIICECNYQQELVSRDLPNFEHKIRGHCSLDTCKNFIAANKTNALRTVILCHMGAETCDRKTAVKEIKGVVGNQVLVDVAEKNKSWEFNLFPF